MALTFIKHPDANETGFSLLKTPVTSDDTLLTTDGMNRTLKQIKDAASLTFEVAEVGLYAGIEIWAYGQGLDNDTATLTVYGWRGMDSPAEFMGTVDVILCTSTSQDKDNASPGWLTAARTSEAIRIAFSQTADWRAADTYTDTDVDSCMTGVGPFAAPGAIQVPGWLILDLSRKQITHLAVFVDITGTTTALGCVFRPLAYKLRGDIE